MLLRLLNGWHLLERKVAEDMSVALAKATRLPAFSYRGPNALKIGKVEGVWARNLLANRLYRCPVVFLEPYRANSKGAYERIIAGNYKGTREFEGVQRSPLLDEYARAVAEGLVRSFVKTGLERYFANESATIFLSFPNELPRSLWDRSSLRRSHLACLR